MQELKHIEQMVNEGNLSGAIDAMASISPKDLDRWEVQNLMGKVCTLCNDYENAKALYRRSLKQHPDQPH